MERAAAPCVEMLTLNAQKIFELGKLDREADAKLIETIRSDIPVGTEARKDGPEFSYYLDLENYQHYGKTVVTRMKRDFNAMFYQLARTKEDWKHGGEPQQRETDPVKLAALITLTDLVYLDFSDLFSPFLREKAADAARREAYHAEAEVLFSRGLVLKHGGEYRLLVPFDRSASMSRKSVITFIDCRLKKRMDERLTLGIFEHSADTPKPMYQLSKVYAYRGLYLSSGMRVNEQECGITLNQETVVVIPDKEITVEEPVFRRGGSAEGDNPKAQFVVSCFDGEGLVSPRWGEQLGEYLVKNGMRGARNATSFQIRLPFGKGMLHTVDFLRFFREELGVDAQTARIRDAFGIERELGKIQILLTVSMFKAFQWVNTGTGNDPDPMKTYFDKVRTLDHALYVLRTDRSLFSDGYVQLNYQFLNTGVLSGGQLNKLLRESLTCYTLPLRGDVSAQRKYIIRGALQAVDPELDAADGAEDEPDTSNPRLGKYAQVVSAREAAVSDPRVQGILRGVVESHYLGAMRGNIFTPGENRFLSGDLMYFLLELAAHLIVYTDNADGSGQGTVMTLEDLKKLRERMETHGLDGLEPLKKQVDQEYRQCSDKKGREYLGRIRELLNRMTPETLTELMNGGTAARERAFEKRLKEQRLSRDRFFAPIVCEWEKPNEQARYPYPMFASNAGFVAVRYPDCPSSRVGISWNEGERYAILRNPHLSRNEQCALFPYNPHHPSNLYYKYLRHLTGVVMLSPDSPEAERLSGADFDGDMVKIYAQKRFNKSAAHCFVGNPLVLIDHEGESRRPLPERVSFSDIKNVFDSKVGAISNLAIQFGEIGYNENLGAQPGAERLAKKALMADYAAECCRIVGHEIDKAKTGKSPNYDVLLEAGGQIGELSFIANKDKLGALKFRTFEEGSTTSRKDKKTRKVFTYYKKGRNSKGKYLFRLQEPDGDAPNLEALMFRVLELRRRFEQGNGEQEETSAQKLPKLAFRSLPDEQLDHGLLVKMAAMIAAYSQIRKTISAVSRVRQRYAGAGYSAFVFNILKMQYDDLGGALRVLPCGNGEMGSEAERRAEDARRGALLEGVTVNDAMERVYLMLEEKDEEGLGKLLEQLTGDNWQNTLPGKDRRDRLMAYFPEREADETAEDSAPADAPAGDWDYSKKIEAAYSLLGNFSSRGYNLLYYMVKNVQCSLAEEGDFANLKRELRDRPDGSTAKKLGAAACMLYRLQGGKCGVALRYYAWLIALKCPTAEKINSLRERLSEPGAEKDTTGFWMAVLAMKNQLKYPVDGRLAGAIEELLGLLGEIIGAYETYYNEYFGIHRENEQAKRDTDETGETDPERAAEPVAQACWRQIEALFREKGAEQAIPYWNRCRSDMDREHVFLWDVFPAEYIIGGIETGGTGNAG